MSDAMVNYAADFLMLLVGFFNIATYKTSSVRLFTLATGIIVFFIGLFCFSYDVYRFVLRPS